MYKTKPKNLPIKIVSIAFVNCNQFRTNTYQQYDCFFNQLIFQRTNLKPNDKVPIVNTKNKKQSLLHRYFCTFEVNNSN